MAMVQAREAAAAGSEEESYSLLGALEAVAAMAMAQAREARQEAASGSAEAGCSHREAPEAEAEMAMTGLAAGGAAEQG